MLPFSRATLALAATWSLAVHAQGVATDIELEPVVVRSSGVRSGLASNVPGSTASKTADDLRQQNLVNAEDALKQMPNTSIRKRYIGDRNALIGGRSFGTLQPSRGLAYVDGYLISNFLGRFDAPRWNMVTPEAIARVDVLYGPFSALYPGNSIGTTVAITEREPQSFEASARVTGFRQQFGEYGQSDHYDGEQLSAYLGNRLASGLWYSASFNHLSATSQPMTYYTVAEKDFVAGAAGTRVDGIRYDVGPDGKRRAVLGASGIDQTLQDGVKFKLGYSFTPQLVASAMLGDWGHASRTSNRPFLRDAAGNTVWSGLVVDGKGPLVTDGNNTFKLPDASFAPAEREELHRHAGLTLKTRHATGWNGSLVYSNYRIVEDAARQANLDEQRAEGGSGSVTRRDGTGWNTFELQAAYTPLAGDFGAGRHALNVGLHRNAYRLDSPTYNADWHRAETALTQHYAGHTRVTAVYAQDAWRLRDDLRLTLGLREAWFTAEGGTQFGAAACAAAATPGAQCENEGAGGRLRYDTRRLRGTSPKASLAWSLPDDLLLKASAGRGVRFPNVEELYNGTFTANSVALSAPDLKPERADAFELSAEKDWTWHRVRVSLFHDEVRDAILRQTDVTVLPQQTHTTNVDRVRTRGIEFVWQAQDVFVKGLSLDANLALARSKVVANAKDPETVGKYWLRVPKVRANLLLAWRPDDRWMSSVAVRHSGRAYNDRLNADVNPDVYGGVSSFTLVDLRLACRLRPNTELALGLDNAADSRAYQSHPYPGRTLFTELRASY